MGSRLALVALAMGIGACSDPCGELEKRACAEVGEARLCEALRAKISRVPEEGRKDHCRKGLEAVDVVVAELKLEAMLEKLDERIRRMAADGGAGR